MWAPLPGRARKGFGVKLARWPARRATSRITSFTITMRSAAAMPMAGLQVTSYWPTPYSGSKLSGSVPAWRSAATICAPSVGSRRKASSENGVAGGRSAPRSWNSSSGDAFRTSPVRRLRSSTAALQNPRVQESQTAPSVVSPSQRTMFSGGSSPTSTRIWVSGAGVMCASSSGPQGLSAMSSNGVSACPAIAQLMPVLRRAG
jgi:hypothetical protein